MENIYKADFYNAVETMENFWERGAAKKPALALRAFSEGFVPKLAETPEQRWFDAGYRYDSYKALCENTYFGGAYVPAYPTDMGACSLAAAIGGNFKPDMDTIWFDHDPIIKDWENLPQIAFNPNSELWKNIISMQKKFLSDKNMITAITDLGGVMDIIAALRGTNDLLLDLYDYPEEIKALCSEIEDIFIEACKQQFELLSDKQQLFTTWMPITSKKPWSALQCDFSALISPKQFEEFVLSSIVKHANWLERSIYHLDGPGEIHHLDMLLDIESLNGIQWVAGAGQKSDLDPCWLPMYKKIQDKGKNLVIVYSDPKEGDYEQIIKSLDPVGLYIMMKCTSRREAEEILENVEKWS